MNSSQTTDSLKNWNTQLLVRFAFRLVMCLLIWYSLNYLFHFDESIFGSLIVALLLGTYLFAPQVIINSVDAVFTRLQNLVGIKGMAYFFVLPNLLIFSIFILAPMLTNFVYAFTGGDRLFLQDRSFVGTDNLEVLFTCENFLDANTCREDLFIRAVGNTAIFVVAQVFWMIMVSLLTALILNRKITGRGFFRSVFFYPVLLSPIVVGLMWRWILQENGILNSILLSMGGEKIAFLSTANWARLWVVIISIWSMMGFYTLILLAGLQAIPSELYEAAAMDGANEFRKFWNVTLPLLMPTMLVVIVLSTIRAVQVFDVVFAFTGGGPGTATYYIVQYIYSNGFASATKEFGLASGASLFMASILIIFTLLQLRLRGTDNVA
jgi:alpha-1,4-digalacturonate transport system permease protein